VLKELLRAPGIHPSCKKTLTEVFECAAVAADPHGMIAALVRRNGESFNDSVLRLNHAVNMAVNHDAPTDEINKR